MIKLRTFELKDVPQNQQLALCGLALRLGQCGFATVARAIHKSGRVGFVPNPDSTRMRRVDKNLTRNRPGHLVRFFGLGLVDFGLTQVGCRVLSSGLKSGRIWRGLAEIWPNPSRSSRDLAGSVKKGIGSIKIVAGFRRITAKSHQISKDMD